MYQDYLNEIDNVPLFSSLGLFLLILCIIIVVLLVTVFLLHGTYEFKTVASDLLGGFCLLGVAISFLSLFIQDNKINQIEESYKQKALVEWVIKTEENLYSMNVQEKVELQGSGGIFLNQLSSNGFTDYRYVIKAENGYQLRTLSKQYPGLSEEDIYIQEKPETVSPKIIFEQRQYKEKEFNKVFDTEGKRVTFIVPEGTVQTKFEEGVIK